MRRRNPIETKINHERWLVSYADFITLLFAFFVVMYSVSQVNENKYRVLSDTLQKAFKQTNVPGALPIPENTPLMAMEALEDRLRESFADMIKNETIRIEGNEDWVEINVNANVLFSSAEAAPSETAKKIFTEVADILSPFENAVAVSGHTDNVPIRNGKFDSNWDLSSARAVAVVNLLAFGGVGPTRLSAIGYGEYQPVANNNSVQGRAENRRVVLRVARTKVVAPKVLAEDALNEGRRENNDDSDSPINTVDGSITAPQTAVNEQIVDSPAQEQNTVLGNTTADNLIEPIKLPGGGLLFTSDPKGRGQE